MQILHILFPFGPLCPLPLEALKKTVYVCSEYLVFNTKFKRQDFYDIGKIISWSISVAINEKYNLFVNSLKVKLYYSTQKYRKGRKTFAKKELVFILIAYSPVRF